MAEAQRCLRGARAQLEADLPSRTVGEAYYAMLYAARAALSEEERYAKTHRGSWTLFNETFVVGGRFDRDLASQGPKLQRMREHSRRPSASSPGYSPCSAADRRQQYDSFIWVARLLSVSLPDDLMTETEALAETRGKTKSEFVRDALRRQIEEERWRDLTRYGRQQAEERGVGAEDVERLVDEVRAQRR